MSCDLCKEWLCEKCLGNKEDLIVRSVSDAAFYSETPAVQGEFILLGSKNTDVVSPLFWKSK